MRHLSLLIIFLSFSWPASLCSAELILDTTGQWKLFQTLKPRDDTEGSGMGLAIVQRIIDWQGGKIWFEDGPNGIGVTFRFTWNKAPQDMPTAADMEAGRGDAAAGNSGNELGQAVEHDDVQATTVTEEG